MKKLFLLCAVLVSINGFSQEMTVTEAGSCYTKWAVKFEERGADNVEDGIYQNAIITKRQGSKSECFNGKVEVKNGMISKMQVFLTDNTFDDDEIKKRTWKDNTDKNATIINGMSKDMVTVYGEIFNVFFPLKIKPRKAKPSMAKDPIDD